MGDDKGLTYCPESAVLRFGGSPKTDMIESRNGAVQNLR